MVPMDEEVITPAALVIEHRELAFQVKTTARLLGSKMGSLVHAADQRLRYGTPAADAWYQSVYQESIELNRQLQELTAQLFR